MKTKRRKLPVTYAEPQGVISFLVLGLPKAQPRARVVCNANTRGKARAYTPDEDGTLALWRQKLQLQARNALKGCRFQGPVFLSVTFLMPCPKDCVRAGEPRWCTTKPDLDNLVKAVKDALTELGAWNDDAQVAVCQLAKLQVPGAPHTGAIVEMEAFGPENLNAFIEALPKEFTMPPPSGGTPASNHDIHHREHGGARR